MCAGGVYADLDLTALRSVAPCLKEAAVVLAANDTRHAANTGCVLRRPCGTHLTNAFMATVRRHPFWLAYFAHVTRHVDTFCRPRSGGSQPRRRVWHTVELTGPYALGHAYEAYQRDHPVASQGMRTLSAGSKGAQLYRSASAASWAAGKVEPRPIGEYARAHAQSSLSMLPAWSWLKTKVHELRTLLDGRPLSQCQPFAPLAPPHC